MLVIFLTNTPPKKKTPVLYHIIPHFIRSSLFIPPSKKKNNKPTPGAPVFFSKGRPCQPKSLEGCKASDLAKSPKIWPSKLRKSKAFWGPLPFWGWGKLPFCSATKLWTWQGGRKMCLYILYMYILYICSLLHVNMIWTPLCNMSRTVHTKSVSRPRGCRRRNTKTRKRENAKHGNGKKRKRENGENAKTAKTQSIP